ncbi:TPA: DUF1947 domain-containing protein [Candidatus Woesearchaeota archaeon]|nr:DUF1947 domain-containing protein [Candidatus Woesearchaeota archaeon]
MKKIQVRSRDIERELTQYAISITKKDHVELLEDAFRVLLINHEPAFFEYHDTWVPALKYLQTHPCLRKVTVDMGAIRFIIGGADIMRPGVVAIDEGIAKDDFVVVVDQTHCKPLSVGIALMDSAAMKAITSGKVVKNIHYVGDELWRMV